VNQPSTSCNAQPVNGCYRFQLHLHAPSHPSHGRHERVNESTSEMYARHAGRALVAILPALLIGFYVGLHTREIGSPREFSSVVVRGLVCAGPAAILALLAPRFWILPGLVYGFGFYCGYIFLEGVGADIVRLLAALTGQHFGRPPEPTHPELLWIFGIALWFGAFTSFLRSHCSRTEENASTQTERSAFVNCSNERRGAAFKPQR
jgi:hypothetical protein